MLRVPNFGRKSLQEIKEELTKMDLRLGMDIAGWPPDNLDGLAKCYQAKLDAEREEEWARGAEERARSEAEWRRRAEEQRRVTGEQRRLHAAEIPKVHRLANRRHLEATIQTEEGCRRFTGLETAPLDAVVKSVVARIVSNHGYTEDEARAATQHLCNSNQPGEFGSKLYSETS